MRRIMLAVACTVPILTSTACAGGALHTDPFPNGSYTMHVQVANESSEIVQVFFLADAGWRVRLATVGPLQTGLFSQRLISACPGRIVIRRLSAPDAPGVLGTVLDPWSLHGGTVLVTVGGSPEFDRWTVRG